MGHPKRLPGRPNVQLSLSHTTCHHHIYSLTCDDYEEMLTIANGKCEICGVANLRPCIEHNHDDGNGMTGVRGLVCIKCNAHLRRVDAGERVATAATAAFLARYAFGKELTQVIPDKLWAAAQAKADQRGEVLSEVIRKALERYVKRA